MTTELDEIKNKIAETEGKNEVEAEKSGDFTRRDRLEELLFEPQKEKNFHLAAAGD